VLTSPSKRLLVAAVAIAATLALASCSGSQPQSQSGTGDAGSSTLETTFSFNMQSPDPDIFFENEGLSIIMAAYEGLLRHTPNAETPVIEPWLATSYEQSPDGLTYTFKLREGVKFHDGSPVDAEAVKFSFERRMKINAGPAEATFGVDRVEAPDPTTVVVHMKQPVSAFIPFMASGYGLKIVSPKTVEEHEVDGDLGQKWLETHDAGSGPYTIESFKHDGYVLKRFDGYWNTPAGFETVNIRIIPDFGSQVLQLESGQLDVMIHGAPTLSLERLQDKGFKVWTEATFNRTTMWLNPETPAFANPQLRLAVAAAIDRKRIVDQVWGEYAVVAEQMYPAKAMPDEYAHYTVTFDPSKLKPLVDALPPGDRKVDLAYTSDDPDNQPMAQIIQSSLAAAGLEVTARAVPQPEIFSYSTKPDARPDAVVLGGASSDAASPDPWARLFYTKTAPLNFFQADTGNDADKVLDQATRTVDPDEGHKLYDQAAKLYQDSGLFIPIADRPEVIVTRPGLTGVEHEFVSPFAIRLASLRNE
jgi:peptide/nickel transport system substrate-binding protein